MESFDLKKPVLAGSAKPDPARPGWINVFDADGEQILHFWHNAVSRIVRRADQPGSSMLVFISSQGGGWENAPVPLGKMHAAIVEAKVRSEAFEAAWREGERAAAEK